MKILNFKNKSLNIFLGYSYRYKWHMIAVIILSIIASAMSAVPAWLSKKFVDDVLIGQNKEMFMWIIGGIFIATVIKVISSYYSEISSNNCEKIIYSFNKQSHMLEYNQNISWH